MFRQWVVIASSTMVFIENINYSTADSVKTLLRTQTFSSRTDLKL